MTKVFVLFFIFVLSFKQTVSAESFRVFYSSLPPYEQISSDGEAEGLGIDKIQSYFNLYGHIVDFKYNSMARGIAALHSGRVDFSTAAQPNEALTETFWISEKPLYYINVGVFRREVVAEIVSFDELAKLSTVSLKDSNFYFLNIPEFTESTNHYKVDDFAVASKLIRTDRFDYFLSYYNPQKHSENIDLEFDQLKSVPVFLILSKQHPNAKQLKPLLNL
ncbi:transporter substrate-binding domain-containing protein [Psychrosphaera sp. B3R10]|uniref:transporter substrate-binding domain-containing protein n=1 Tax=unclassified Psychrosphaera TaxID=2641570 RepID=UPI001C0A07BD|nr:MULTISPECIES: transporter substrate-binding domain-containing protein [unclassified Psychrosphaera]MBU2882652.1 transporter substrate-binding domain-containing protein [Psychrosphaera sp. I2R16]MBU2989329.1 transporter substrate-binding domain-containing protein [Psychrosphaera sp. B3R10]